MLIMRNSFSTKHICDVFMRFKRSGNNIGRLKIAISPELLFVLEEIAAIKVSIEAKVALPNIKHRIKGVFSVIGFPKKML